MRTRRWLRPVAIGMLVGLVSVSFAACGDDDEPNEAASPTATETGDEEEVDGEPTVTIEMKDYSFAVSGDLAEGGSIEFTNTGAEFHMTGFGKLEKGKTIDDVEEALEEQSGPPPGEGGEEGSDEGAAANETARAAQATSTTAARGAQASTTVPGGGEEGQEGGEEEDPFEGILEEVSLPGSFFFPGTAATVSADNLEPGDYALICFIPTEGDGAPHYEKGMLGELKVGGGEPPDEPTPVATYSVAENGKITGPTTLAAGEQTIAIEAAAGAGEQEPTLVKPRGAATFATVDKALTDLFESEEPPAKGAISKVPVDTLFGLFDLEDVETVYITHDFEPGTYYLVAEDSDDESEEFEAPLRITVSSATSGTSTTSGGRAGTTGSSTTAGRVTTTTAAARSTTTR